jgi:mono/diheme cytochrome c family protein
MGVLRSSSVTKFVWATAALFAAVAVSAVLLVTEPLNPFIANSGNAAFVAEGHALYTIHCSSCHGRSLEGQPNWQTPLPNGRMPAPPHDASGHTWHHSDDDLTGIVKFGLKPYVAKDYESDMPAFEPILKDREILAIVTYIRSTWPEREQAYQEQITQQSKAK